jgi:hypothetical protein
MRRLFERVRERNEARFAERAARERHAGRAGLRDEAGGERRRDKLLSKKPPGTTMLG